MRKIELWGVNIMKILLHLVLTLLTGGLWLLVLVIAYLLKGLK